MDLESRTCLRRILATLAIVRCWNDGAASYHDAT